MPDTIRMFDFRVGIQDVLAPQDLPTMPEARHLPTTGLVEGGLDELYSSSNSDSFLEQSLCPAVGDGSFLAPEVFSSSLRECLNKLKDNPRPEVRSFVSGELASLLENEELLQAYSGLLVGG